MAGASSGHDGTAGNRGGSPRARRLQPAPRMTMTMIRWGSLLCLVAACKTNDAPKDEPKKNVEPTKKEESKKAATTVATCANDETGGGDVPFCIKLPAGFVAGKVEKRDDWMLDFTKSGSAVEVNTKWSDRAPLTAFKDTVDLLKREDKTKEQGELAGGNGYFATTINSEGNDKQQLRLEAKFKGSKYLMTCEVSWWTDQPDGQAAADACKSFSPR
jgi:hypothetical protein